MDLTATNPEQSHIDEIAANRERYGVDRWGRDYFDISDSGNLLIKAPTKTGCQSVELMEIIQGLKDRGLEMPVMLRLENILNDRVIKLNQAFRQAIQACNYQNEYRGVFPIKVNQQQQVVADITHAGAEFGHGLEAGSKAELLIAMASLEDQQALIDSLQEHSYPHLKLKLSIPFPILKYFFNLHTIVV